MFKPIDNRIFFTLKKFVYQSLCFRVNMVLFIGLDKHNYWAQNCKYFLPISFNICFGCLDEPSHWDGSFEYPQHMFWLRIKKIIFWYAPLTKGLYFILIGWFLSNLQWSYSLFVDWSECWFASGGKGKTLSILGRSIGKGENFKF